jgi:hypothetical protein
MSVVERTAARGVENALRFGTIVIVGGGCYGSYYVRQLLRAREAGAATWSKLLVVDRDPDCAVAAAGTNAQFQLVTSDWRVFFANYLSRAAIDRDASKLDAIVPSPLMPHLMFDWVVERARQRWPDRDVHPEPLLRAADTPWQRRAADGTQYVSFAEWMCPINCIEPQRCPHTRKERTWSLPVTAREYVRRAQERGEALAGPVIFHCVHRTYGVGMFDTQAVLEGDQLVRDVAEQAGAAILVGTMSHCHGAWARLVVGAPRGSVSP